MSLKTYLSVGNTTFLVPSSSSKLALKPRAFFDKSLQYPPKKMSDHIYFWCYIGLQNCIQKIWLSKIGNTNTVSKSPMLKEQIWFGSRKVWTNTKNSNLPNALHLVKIQSIDNASEVLYIATSQHTLLLMRQKRLRNCFPASISANIRTWWNWFSLLIVRMLFLGE